MSYPRTDLLKLLPLTIDQLRVLARDRAALETALGLTVSDLQVEPISLSEFSGAILSHTVPFVESADDNFEWRTHWLVVYEPANTCIGGIGGGLVQGDFIIGYFIDRKYASRGFATQVLRLYLQWVFTRNPELSVIFAETPKDHIASQRVLAKNAFLFDREVAEGYRWKLERPADGGTSEV